MLLVSYSVAREVLLGKEFARGENNTAIFPLTRRIEK